MPIAFSVTSISRFSLETCIILLLSEFAGVESSVSFSYIRNCSGNLPQEAGQAM